MVRARIVKYVSLAVLILGTVAACGTRQDATVQGDCQPKTVEGIVQSIDVLTIQASSGEVGRSYNVSQGPGKPATLVPFLYAGKPFSGDAAIEKIRSVQAGNLIRIGICTTGPYIGYPESLPEVIAQPIRQSSY